MELNIGDKVRVRTQKDLYNEYGENREPYVPPLGFRDCLLKQVGEIIKVENHRGHECVLVQYSGYDIWSDRQSWWYYPEVLHRVNS